MQNKRYDAKLIPKKDSSIKQSMFEIGKIPPQAIELEEAVLGAIMLEKDCARIVIDFLPPEAFYVEKHEEIYRAIIHLYDNSVPIDILTVTNEMKRRDALDRIGGAFYITTLTNRVASSANVEFHARIIYQKFIQRELIRISTQSIQSAYQDACDIFDLLDENYNLLNAITGRLIKSPAKGSAKLFAAFMRQLDTISNSDSAINGVPTLLTKVNKITKGLQDSDLIIIAARPGMGKTASIKTIAKGCMLVKKKKCLVFSLEMTSMQLIARFMSEDVQISADSFNSKDFLDKTSYNALNSAITGYFNENHEDMLIIDDTPGLYINELRARAKKICAENTNDAGECQIGEIIVDYIGKVKGQHENKVYEIGEVTSGLKALAKELNIPVVAYSQLNRECEKRNPPKPVLSDLRSSGEIEQDADVIIFLYRPEYYGLTEDEQGMPTNGLAEWIFAKHRNGETGTVAVKFIDYLTKFQDMYVELESREQPKQISYNPSQGLTPNDKFWDSAKNKDELY